MRTFNLNKRKNKVKYYYCNNSACTTWAWDVHNKCLVVEHRLCNRYMNMFRKPRTKHERTAYLSYTEDELYYNVKYRRKRSIRMLPDDYDDICINAWDVQKSWKNNSKRRRQWNYE